MMSSSVREGNPETAGLLVFKLDTAQYLSNITDKWLLYNRFIFSSGGFMEACNLVSIMQQH